MNRKRVFRRLAIAVLGLTLAFAPLFCSTASALDEVPINASTFPDDVFRAYVSKTIDTDKDGELSIPEISMGLVVNVDDMDISSLAGIEYLQGLQELSMRSVKLSEPLDLSQNTDLIRLRCNNCGLTELDLSGCPNLQHLSVNDNGLSELDVSGYPNLMELSLMRTNIATLDTSGNPILEKLFIRDTHIGSLDVTANQSLKVLDAWNTDLMALDVSSCPDLEELSVSKNGGYSSIEFLDVSHNPKLRYLSCYSTSMEMIDVRGCPLLVKACAEGSRQGIGFNGYYLKQDDVTLSISTSVVTKIIAGDVIIDETTFPDEPFREYVSMIIDKDGDGWLSIEEAQAAVRVSHSGRGVASLKGIEYLAWAEEIACSYNWLKELDLRWNFRLEELDCSHNQIASLKLPAGSGIRYVRLYDNPLASFDAGPYPNLRSAVLYGNYDTYGGYMSAFEAGSGDNLHVLMIDQDVDLSIDGLMPIVGHYFPDVKLRGYLRGFDVNRDGMFSEYERGRVGEINCSGMWITSLEGIEYFTHLGTLDCSDNVLPELDLSKNYYLRKLYCQNNSLTHLNTAGAPFLEELYCYGNSIGRLDLLKNDTLTQVVTGGSLTEYADTTLYESAYGKLWIDKSTEIGLSVIPITEEYFPDPAFRAIISSGVDRDASGTLNQEELGLRELNVENKGISSLKGIEFFTELWRLYCAGNAIKELDVSSMPGLYRLDCCDNGLKTLILGNNDELLFLSACGNAIETLDLSGCPILLNAYTYPLNGEPKILHDDERDYDYLMYESVSGTLHIDTDTAVITAAGHALKRVAAKAPTMKESGCIEHYYCSLCGNYYEDSDSARQLTWKEVMIPRIGVDIVDAFSYSDDPIFEVSLDKEREDKIFVLVCEYDAAGRFLGLHVEAVLGEGTYATFEDPESPYRTVMVTDEDGMPLGESLAK